MNQKLRLLMMTLLCAVFSVAWGATKTITLSEQGYENEEAVSSTSSGDVTLTYNKGNSSSDPKYYNTGTGVRVYAGGNMTVTANSQTITKVIVTFGKNSSPSISMTSNGTTTTAGNESPATWEGSATEVYFNVSTKGHARIQKVEVTYTSNNPFISVSPTTINAGYEGVTNGELSITANKTNTGRRVTCYDANGTTVVDKPTWFTYTFNSNGTALSYNIAENTGEARTLYFRVEAQSLSSPTDYILSELVTVTQAAAPTKLSIPWTEDFSGEDPLSKYIVESAEVYSNNYAEGTPPELMIRGKGFLTAKFDMNGYSGFLTLTFKSNHFEYLEVSFKDDNANEISISKIENNFVISVPEGTNTLSLTVKNTKSSDNARVDDFNLVKGKPQVPANLSYSSESFTAYLGEENVFPVLSNEYNLPITYSSSNEDIATIDTNGNITLNAAGTTTITATSEETTDYYAGEASYTLTVIDPNVPGGKNNPYTVAEARAAIDAGTGVQDVYATGIVSKIVTQYNSQYGNITYNISDDGSEETDQLQAYRGKSYNGANFKSADDIKVGDVVVIKGNLIKYGSTYEFEQNNQLVSLVRPTAPPVITASPNVELAFDATTGEIEYSIENPVDGQSLTVATDANWISNISVGTNKVTFETTANEGEERTATITLAYEGAEDVIVTVTQEAYVAPGTTTTYVKVTKTEDITDGNYLIVYEEGSVAFDGSRGTLDGANNTKEVILDNGMITTDKEIYFTINTTDGTIKSASGYYIGMSSWENNLRQGDAATNKTHSFSIDDDENAIIAITFTSGDVTLRYNSDSNQHRFRYYKSSQKPIQLYKEVKEQPIEEDTPFTLTISSSAGDGDKYYATMSAIGNGNFVVPEGIEASAITVENNKIKRAPIYGAGQVLDGKEAYLIETISGENLKSEYVFEPTDGDITYGINDNWLYPATKNVEISGPDEGKTYKFYQLSLNSSHAEGSVGFYYGPESTNGEAFAFKSEHKAFLAVPVEEGTGASIGLFDGFDGIADAIVNEGAQRSVYTLTGVRVDSKQLPKGIYIIDGKKQVVK